MKPIFNISLLAALLILLPSPCFAMWDVETATKARAKELDIQIRSHPAGPNHLRIELDFPTTGPFKNFTQGKSSSDPSRVDLRLGKGDDLMISASLREDRSKPGRILVSFTISRSQLDKVSLWIMVAHGLGGSAYDLQLNQFVDPRPEH